MEPDKIVDRLKDAEQVLKSLEEERDNLYRELSLDDDEDDDWDEDDEDDESSRMMERYRLVNKEIPFYENSVYKLKKEIEDAECKLKCRFYKKWNTCPKRDKARCAYLDVVNYKRLV